MGDAAVTFLLDNMADLVKTHANLISGAEYELRMLSDELMEMKILLEDASKKRYREEHFKVWERKLRSVVYEAEDVIDTCITDAAVQQRAGRFRRLFNERQSLAERIMSLREGDVKDVLDASAIVKAKLQFVSESDPIEEIKTLRNKALRQDNVVGFEIEINTLIQKLKEETNSLDVISIVGMPGLGKTTLAWNIYRHGEITYEFPVRIWVNVSQHFNMKKVLLTILRKFTPEDMQSYPTHVLNESVKNYLMKEKFVLFMDDVWTIDAWKEIEKFLPKNNMNGKVLMTTRNVLVSRYASSPRPSHPLKFLTDEETAKLLHAELNGALDETSSRDRELYGKSIAKACQGLPLAIEVMGALLVEKCSTTEDTQSIWETVSTNVMGCLFDEDLRHNMENSIAVSYENLPYELRDCFLYLGMFPEDTEINTSKLIQMWVAEGFIKKEFEKSLEDTARNYLKELINMNLVMVVRIKFNGEIKTCKVHNTVRKFCQKTAGYEGQNMFEEIRKSEDGSLKPSNDIIENCHRLSIHSYVFEFFTKKKPKLEHIRSILIHSDAIDLELKSFTVFTDNFALLRVFDAGPVKFPKFPVKITSLIHLRYITFSCFELRVLPVIFSKLWNLQSLTVYTLSNSLEIKADLTRMMQLRHVKTKASIILNMSLRSGDGGENLQTLSRLSPESCTRDLFEKAKNLKNLGIHGELATLVDSRCLENLHELENLKLINHVVRKVASENPLIRLPCTFPQKLKFLTLSNTYLDWSHMSTTVGNIPNLEALKLKDNAFVGDSWNSVAGGFLELEYLYIASTNLVSWKASNGSFPKLKSLSLVDCKHLEAVPLEVSTNLELLSLQHVPKSAVISARKIKEAKMEGTSKSGGFKLILAPEDDV